ncbi:hypothetical protein GT347_19020 [Xylophilus rhododendri]|uniref:Uncharacterized protein n=1 Tax=Xylophilus rhododendri TaxID=2697032 RepID=A0A857JAX3_9BURK|nr:hypothetical protein [Xylophilus rhododendri]QHI99888.1 hypothetical protein GT347_19020 [Xylophilus rhododendri]
MKTSGSTLSSASPLVVSRLFQNWDADTPPPLQINPDAPLHSLLAWCWGEALGLEGLASALIETTGGRAEVVNLFYARLTPLVAMLEHVSAATWNRTQGGAG